MHCAFLPLRVSHKSHQHELKLYLGVINKKDEVPDEFCKICSKVLSLRNFCYYCLDCEFGVHTFCATNEVKPELYVVDDSVANTEATSSNTQAAAVNEPTAEEVIVELYNLQLQMQMAQGLAQMMASFNPSLS